MKIKYLILAIWLLKSDLKIKINEIKNELPSITGLARTSALTAVEIPSISNLVKKTDYNTKVKEIEKKITDHKHDEHITTPKFNKLAIDIFNARLVQANLIKKTDFDNKMTSFNRKIVSNKTKDIAIEKKF